MVLGGCGPGDIISLDTQVFYICGQYSLVFVLDMSPNMHTVVCVPLLSFWFTKYFSPFILCTPLLSE